MNQRGVLIVGLLFALTGVVLGAFGAHGLESALPQWYANPEKKLATWNTAVEYQMYHALGLLALGAMAPIADRWRSVAGVLMTLGVLVFSGLLYLYVLLDQRWMAMVVPIGGTLMILAWGAALIGVWQGRKTSG